MSSRKCNVLVFIGCRSDEGLSAPVLKRLEHDPFFHCDVQPLFPADYLKTYKLVQKIFTAQNKGELHKTDLVLITGDRIEMAAAAMVCFFNQIPIAHLYAGIIANRVTYDETLRHQITLMSDIAFTENGLSHMNVKNLCNVINKEIDVYNVGITHLDDLTVDESLVPKEDYDLVLINGTTIGISERVLFKYEDRKQITIGPNPDTPKFSNVDYDNLPRPQFLGLLKNCTRFITNSSAAYYEAPYFLDKEQIVMVGNRNRKRSTDFGELRTGASDRIVNILKDWWEEHGA